MIPTTAPDTPQLAWRGGASRRDLVVCAVDDDGHAMDVIATGAHLAAAGRVDLLFVHVVRPWERAEEARGRGMELLQRLGLGGANTRVVVGRSPARELLAAARSTQAASVVVGSGPRTALRRAMRGSVTHELLHAGTAPIVVARSAGQLAFADGPVVVGLAGRRRAARATAQLGARMAGMLDRPLVLAGFEVPCVEGLDVCASAFVVVDRRDPEVELRSLAQATDAALLVVPYPRGVLERFRRRARVAERLAATCTAPIAAVRA